MDYKKRFIVLNKEDEKFCENGATGYCKIETVNNKCTIRVFVQGLKQYQDYKVYLIKDDGNSFLPVILGSFKSANNKSEIITEVDAKDVLSTGESITGFNVVGVYINDTSLRNSHQFPLVGYDNIQKNRLWREKFNRYISSDDSSLDIKNEPEQKVNVENKKAEEIPVNKSYESNGLERSYFDYLKEGNMQKINELMTQTWGGVEFQPFANVKLKYKWWKITNMNFFEDIFKFSILSRQIFRHPLIKKKIRQYGYCSYGVVTDVDEKIKYFAFAFPSEYIINDQIYIGGFSVFYPSQGFEKRNGSFGYWVVHVKIDDENIVMKI